MAIAFVKETIPVDQEVLGYEELFEKAASYSLFVVHCRGSSGAGLTDQKEPPRIKD